LNRLTPPRFASLRVVDWDRFVIWCFGKEEAMSRQLGQFCILLATACLAFAIGCRTTPVTGRRQLLVVPESQEIAQGLSAYQEVVSKEPVSKNQQYVELVNRVGHRIADVAGRPDYEWEFRVIASPTQNAFCLPGGKVAVYEGIMPICQTEAGLAVVMSHEIGHAIARHGGERLSQQKVSSGVRQAISYASRSRTETEQKLILAAYGGAAKYGYILPYSREHESEADHIGILLMASAGYDPNEAPRFWERFAAAKEGSGPIEFLSTHPSDQRRAADLRALLPQAIRRYESASANYGIGESIR
jgi:predicted Zn-dependent protease